ncbi:MAG: hypothetical protein GX163_10790 [Bacteroidetes bacterium]|nr:hypothetical protein [Bacteroidota bacterium]
MKAIYVSILFSVFLSCASSPKTAKGKCPKIYENDFTEILNDVYITIHEKDTLRINEIRYKCVYSSFYTHKAMYDKYGKWDKAIFPNNRNYPILMWHNIDLFSNEKKYTVLTNGLEEWEHIYASVMVLDENENDILAAPTEEKIALTNLFGDLIKNNNLNKRDFYEAYWKMVDPKRWREIEKYQRK